MLFCKMGKHTWEYVRDQYNFVIRRCLRCPVRQRQVQGRESPRWIRYELRKD